MKEKILEIINDEDSYIPPEWLIYSKSNSAILIVKNEIDELIKQLKIAVKAGDFDDYFEREAPALFEKLSVKREELVSLLHYERTKEKRKDVYKVDLKPFVSAEEQAPAVIVPNPAPMLAETPKTIEQKLSVLAKVSQSYSDANLYIAGILGIILVVVQVLFNFTFENRLKNNVQETVVQNLENRLRLAENKNVNLAQNLNQLRQQAVPPAKGRIGKNGVFLLAPVKFKQDPVLTKLYEKEKVEARLAAKKANQKQSYLAKQKRKLSSVAKTKAKAKNKLSASKTPRYTKRN